MKEMVGGCCVCSDERGWDENPLVYCDGQGCTVAVHQACYGIVTVPPGPWFCRKCESNEKGRVRCEICPSRDGAFKRTDSNGWAHVVCALYIPEVRFGNVTTMEPIFVSLIPPERFNKTCYICEESSRGSKASTGACMECNKPGCKQNFHVTCAQMLGLLCEEAGNMMDNVKYCGYCQHHYGKLKKTSNMKIIPPFRPVPNNPSLGSNGSESSPLVVLNKDHVNSSDINRSSTMKKRVSGGSSSNSSSKNSTSTTTTSSRMASSNSVNTFSNCLAKSSERNDSSSSGEHSSNKSVEDSFVLKSEDLKEKTSNSSCNGDSNKFLKSSDFMTVKLNDVLTASLDRPIHETNRRDKSQPPDIKPHVTLTPIPMGSNGKLHDKSSNLFGQQSGHNMSKMKDLSHKSSSPEKDKSLTDISTTLFAGESKLTLASTKRTRNSVDLDSSSVTQTPHQNSDLNRLGNNTEYGMASSNWDINKQSQNTPISKTNSDDRSVVSASPNNAGSPEELNLSPMDNSPVKNQAPAPLKRGPGRPPVKRKVVLDREDERTEDNRKKTKRVGRPSSSYSSRDDFSELSVSASLIDDNSVDNSKKMAAGNVRKPTQTPKKIEEPTPTLSQLKAQMDASKIEAVSSIFPVHMFGNALNPASSMAQRMVDTLSQEMETIAAAGVGCGEKLEKITDKLVGIPLPKYSSKLQNAKGTSSAGSSQSNTPRTLEQLLEGQWEQGSQFLMEQAQHLDIAQLLSCLNQLKQDNRVLEEHVTSLLQRKELLTAINARLSIPLGNIVTMNGSLTGLNNPFEDRMQESAGSQHQRCNQATAEAINPQQQLVPVPNRPINFTGVPVPVVVTAHPSPHNTHQGHGIR